jgi:histidinol dehydrogenase
MGVVPAQVAGVAEIVVTTPADPDGEIAGALLAAAALLGVHEVYAVGGAQAVAALAYGTETIGRVEKIVGPGNAWVTAAKLAVYGDCAVDLPAGPSESLVLADDNADARVVAADLLCQAEHGPDSPVLLVTTSPELGAEVELEIDRLLPRLARSPILEKSLGDHGMLVLAPTHDDAIDFANAYAPEHLSIHTTDAAGDAARLTAAGSVFVGHWSPESAGDYATGANHVLPTGGLAAAYGPLSVEDFGSWRQVQELTRDGLATLRPTIVALAEAEGLTAHRLAADIRFEEAP